MKCQNKRALGAGSSSKSIRPEEITTPVIAAELGNNRRSATAYRGTAGSRKTLLHPWTKTALKFYLAYGLAGIAIASMLRTLSESPNNIKNQPTKGRRKWQ